MKRLLRLCSGRVFTFLSLLACTLSLFSQEWVRQHPFAGFAPLHAITFDDNGNGWAVGQQSLILHSNDWGEIWTIQSGDLPAGYTFEAVEIIPGTNAQTILVGGPGLFRTDDGGETWSFVFIGQTLDGVYRIRAFDQMNWIAMGLSTIAKTTNGGIDWEVLPMPDNSANTSDFVDMQNGWAGSGPFNAYQMYKTTNGGTSWTLADDDQYVIITDVEMLNTQTGFMAARDHVYKTTNGGSSWTRLHNDAQPSINGFHVVNENIIWCGLNNGFVFFTLNGGADWEQMNPNLINSNQVFDVYATDDGRAWIPGKYASIQYTANSGLTWKDQTPGTKNSLFDVEFDGNVGFATGSEGVILRTTNGGAIWENIGSDPLETFLAISIFKEGNTCHVFAGSSTGTVFYSTNNGDDWEIIGQSLGQIRSIYARNAQAIVVGTENDIDYTSNGGQNWASVAAAGNLVSEIEFDGITGYAAIHDGRILKSIDGGASWNPTLERATYRFSGVHFNTALEGWVVAEIKDSVWTTKDGGASWTSNKLPRNTFWQDIDFMNADTGYISGGSSGHGLILRTTNGGQSWVTSFEETEFLNHTYIRPDEEYVWVVGFGGNILHFSPCAVSPQISNLSGDTEPCEGEISVYEVDAEGATVFTWTLPAGWTIAGNDNSARVEVLVGPGSGQITIQAANSCGTQTNQLSINVSSIFSGEVSIMQFEETLFTTLDNVTYQWLNNGEQIPGATNSSYTPTVTGTYTLVVTFPNGCTATSNDIFVIISGVRDIHKAELLLYPNPVQNTLTLHIDAGLSGDVRVFDMHGKNVMHEALKTSIDVSDLGVGMYLITVETEKTVYVNYFIKVK